MNTSSTHEEHIVVAGEKYRCIFQREGRDGYFVTCDDLPAMSVFAPTLTQARARASAEIAELVAEEARTQAWIAAAQPEWWSQEIEP